MTAHLDDETLSALLDGEAGDAGAHLDACDACRARLDAFRRVADVVGAPPPPVPEAIRERHLAAARAVHGVPPARSRRWAIAAGLAAAAVAAAVAVPLALRDDGRGEMATRGSAAPEARVEAGAGKAAAGGPVDLGPLDEASLPAAVRAHLRPESGAAALAAPSAPQPCEASLRDATPGLPGVALAADATWKGTPAVVLVLGSPPGPLTAYVMAADGCRILYFARLP